MGPYLGDFEEDAIVDFKWDTNDGDGSAITRATNGTISVYKANGVSPSVSGITDTEDFNTVTGVHHLRIDLSAHSFYAIANDYQVVLSGATIDGNTVNAVLCTFSIENRGVAGAKANWDRLLTGATHNIATSAGRRMRQISDAFTVTDQGTAQAGAAGQITLQAGASAVDALYHNQYITITAGTGAGQTGLIATYIGSTKVATFSEDLAVALDGTSEYVVWGSGATDIHMIGDSITNANNLASACAAYSATRGLAGTALPAAVADAAGGLPVSDAGGLDVDTAMGVLTGAMTELTETPSPTPTLTKAIMLLYMALRNKRVSTSSVDQIHNDAGTPVMESAVTDASGTTTIGKMADS